MWIDFVSKMEIPRPIKALTEPLIETRLNLIRQYITMIIASEQWCLIPKKKII